MIISIRIRSEEKNNCKGCSKTLQELTQNTRMRERRRKKENTMVFGTKPAAREVYAPHHRVQGVSIYQTPHWKMIFFGRIAPHSPLERHGAIYMLVF